MISAIVLTMFAVLGTVLVGVAGVMAADPPARPIARDTTPSHGVCPHCGAETYRKAA